MSTHPAPGGQDQGARPGVSPSTPGLLPCELCCGSGWLQFEDPMFGGLVDARCPDCEDLDEHD